MKARALLSAARAGDKICRVGGGGVEPHTLATHAHYVRPRHGLREAAAGGPWLRLRSLKQTMALKAVCANREAAAESSSFSACMIHAPRALVRRARGSCMHVATITAAAPAAAAVSCACRR